LDYLRLFFTEEREDMAVHLAILKHLGNGSFIEPEDRMEDLIGWRHKSLAEIVAFIVALEEGGLCPKEAFAEVDTFRELVDYVADRSRTVGAKRWHTIWKV